MNNQIRHFKLFIMFMILQLTVGCTSLLSSGLLGSGFMESSIVDTDDGLLESLDDSDAALMQEGPMPIPVTMSKLNGIDPTKLIFEIELYDAYTMQLLMVRKAMAASESCEAGFVCKVSVSGLPDAVTEDSVTDILFYLDDDNATTSQKNPDGSFDQVSLYVDIAEGAEDTPIMTFQGLTDDDWLDPDTYGSYPVYTTLTIPEGTVHFMLTNTDQKLVTGVLHIDEYGNHYYALAKENGRMDVFRQSPSGGMPLAVVLNSLPIDEISTAGDLVYLYLVNGSIEVVEIDEGGGAKLLPLSLNVLRQALAVQNTSGERVTHDGTIIQNPEEIARFPGFGSKGVGIIPYFDGIIVTLHPDQIEDQSGLNQYPFFVGRMDVDGEITTIVPRFVEQNAPMQASVNFNEGMPPPNCGGPGRPVCQQQCGGPGQPACQQQCGGEGQPACQQQCGGEGQPACQQQCGGEGQPACQQQCGGEGQPACQQQCGGEGQPACQQQCGGEGQPACQQQCGGEGQPACQQQCGGEGQPACQQQCGGQGQPACQQQYPTNVNFTLGDGIAFVLAEFPSGRLEFSSMLFNKKTSVFEPWEDRNVISENMHFDVLHVGSARGTLIFSAINVHGDLEFLMYRQGKFSTLWSYNERVIHENFGENLRIIPGVVMDPSGRFIVSCAQVLPENYEQLSEKEVDEMTAATGYNLVAHHIGVDEQHVFNVIARGVSANSCPNALQIVENRLYYYTRAKDGFPPQLSFMDLETNVIMKPMLED